MLTATSIINDKFSPEIFATLKAYKENLKKSIQRQQEDGNADEWQNSNFVLYNFHGLRKSHRQKGRINYTSFFD